MSRKDETLHAARVYQEDLAHLCLCLDPNETEGLGSDPTWALYRRLVRSRLFETIEHAFERLEARLGREVVCG